MGSIQGHGSHSRPSSQSAGACTTTVNPSVAKLDPQIEKDTGTDKKKLFMYRYRYYLNNTGIFMT